MKCCDFRKEAHEIYSSRELIVRLTGLRSLAISALSAPPASERGTLRLLCTARQVEGSGRSACQDEFLRRFRNQRYRQRQEPLQRSAVALAECPGSDRAFPACHARRWHRCR